MNEKERLAKIKSMEKELAELKKVKPKLDSRFEKVDPDDDRWHKPNFGSETGREPGIIVVTRGDAHFNAGTYAGGHPGKNSIDGLVDIAHGCYVLSKNGRTWKRLRPRTGGIITWAWFDKECINAIYVARHGRIGNYFKVNDLRQLWIGTYRW
jgi:hypothetical protein